MNINYSRHNEENESILCRMWTAMLYVQINTRLWKYSQQDMARLVQAKQINTCVNKE